MTGAARVGKALSAALVFALCLTARPIRAQETETSTWTLALKTRLTSMLLDYELPGHANTHGRGHAGTVGRATLVFAPDALFEVEAGVLARLPFAEDFEVEAGALPILSLTLHPYGDSLILRFGSLDDRHGYHP